MTCSVFDWSSVGEQISAATAVSFQVRSQRLVGGGCINTAYVIEGGGCNYFVKTNTPDKLGMFAAEAAGLDEITETGAVRVPKPVCWGVAGNQAFLVLEYIRLGGDGRGAAERLGGELARMHRFTSPRFGWRCDNTIGSTLQVNEESGDWVGFWREHRLGYQLRLASRNGYEGCLRDLGERLGADLGAFFQGYAPQPSLLHGDLWCGNVAADKNGRPVIFDPAVYYGDREADLAMTELFGGFSAGFYGMYRDAWPLDPGYGVRRDLYNLYHVLNHLNLFGGGYANQAERMLEGLLSEIG